MKLYKIPGGGPVLTEKQVMDLFDYVHSMNMVMNGPDVLPVDLFGYFEEIDTDEQ